MPFQERTGVQAWTTSGRWQRGWAACGAGDPPTPGRAGGAPRCRGPHRPLRQSAARWPSAHPCLVACATTTERHKEGAEGREMATLRSREPADEVLLTALRWAMAISVRAADELGD